MAAGGNQGWIALRSGGCPAQNLQISAGIFDKGAAAFNPVSIVKVEDVADLAHFGVVDVAAHHAVDAALGGGTRHDLLVARDIFDRVLDGALQVGRQRPVGQAERAADRVQPVVELERQRIGTVADMGEPLGAADDAVELVAMDDQQAQAVGGFVDRLERDLDAGDAAADIGAQEFVVIARDVDDARAVIDLSAGPRRRSVPAPRSSTSASTASHRRCRRRDRACRRNCG